MKNWVVSVVAIVLVALSVSATLDWTDLRRKFNVELCLQNETDVDLRVSNDPSYQVTNVAKKKQSYCTPLSFDAGINSLTIYPVYFDNQQQVGSSLIVNAEISAEPSRETPYFSINVTREERPNGSVETVVRKNIFQNRPYRLNIKITNPAMINAEFSLTEQGAQRNQ